MNKRLPRAAPGNAPLRVGFLQGATEGFARGQASFMVQGKCMTGIEIRLAEEAE